MRCALLITRFGAVEHGWLTTGTTSIVRPAPVKSNESWRYAFVYTYLYIYIVLIYPEPVVK